MASATAIAHHHRSTTKTANKPFKTRHSTKSALKDRAKGKVEQLEKGSRRTRHQQVMSKIDRRNHAKQIRRNKLADRREEKSVFEGRDGAPRVVAVVPLCSNINTAAALENLNASVDVAAGEQEQEADQSLDVQPSRPWRLEIPRFKQRVQYLTPERQLLACLDACRTADFVLFLLSATKEVDEYGEQILRCVESQGVSTAFTAAVNLSSVEPAKKRPDLLKSLKSFITHFFATQEKVHDLDNRQDCSNIMRSLCTTTPRGIRWRDDRSWMVIEDCKWEDGIPVVTGVVRGRGLKADRLVQVGDWGDFQVEKITAAPLESRRKPTKNDAMAVDTPGPGDLLESPSEDTDDLAQLAPEDTMVDDIAAASVAPSERKAVLLDDHHYFHDNEQDRMLAPKRLPRGTSKYQAAWYLGDVSDSGSDLESVDEDFDMEAEELPVLGPADGHFAEADMAEPTEGAPTEYPQSEAFDDRTPDEEAEELNAYREKRRGEAQEDMEFPDEIELHPKVLARERLARYRGLKNLRTSMWDTEEDLPYQPENWARLLEIADYKSAKNKIIKEALEGGVKPGTRVNIHLRTSGQQRQELRALQNPTALFSLLRHEHKLTAVNCSIALSSDYPNPLRSKDQLFLQCGPRRLAINPLFSQAGNTPNDVHKFDRYLHPGRTAVASFIGPATWGNVPCLYFQRSRPATLQGEDAVTDLAQAITANSPSPDNHDLNLIATGTSLPPSTSRVIAKRVILTGHPYKIHKKLVTVRYMFFNAEDVQYFQALQLWTRRGRSGFMKEPLGTHGYFKATFDGKINPLDALAVSLYKRVWPRQARSWREENEQHVPELVEVEGSVAETGVGQGGHVGDDNMVE